MNRTHDDGEEIFFYLRTFGARTSCERLTGKLQFINIPIYQNYRLNIFYVVRYLPSRFVGQLMTLIIGGTK